MKISVNDTEVIVDDRSTITRLLEQLERSGNGIAVAVNQEVVTRDHWPQHELQDSDRIMIIQATQGG